MSTTLLPHTICLQEMEKDRVVWSKLFDASNKGLALSNAKRWMKKHACGEYEYREGVTVGALTYVECVPSEAQT